MSATATLAPEGSRRCRRLAGQVRLRVLIAIAAGADDGGDEGQTGPRFERDPATHGHLTAGSDAER